MNATASTGATPPVPPTALPWDVLRPVRGLLLAGCVLQAGAALCALLPPLALAWLAADLSGARLPAWLPAPPALMPWLPLCVAALGMLLQLLGHALALHLTHVADCRLQRDLRHRLCRQVARLPLAWLLEQPATTVQRLIQDDVAALHQAVAHTPAEAAQLLILPAACLGLLWWASPPLALVALLPPLFAMLHYRRLRQPTYRRQSARVQAAAAALPAAADAWRRGALTYAIHGHHADAQARFRRANRRHARCFRHWIGRWGGTGAGADMWLSPLAMMSAMLAATVALTQVAHLPPLAQLPPLTTAQWVLFVLLAPMLATPVAALAHGGDQFMAGLAAARRIDALLRLPPLAEPATTKAAAAPCSPPAGAAVHFENVSLSLPASTGQAPCPLLRDIDCTLPAGRLTALVGPSGAGKSTLAGLLSRFRDVSAGRIRLDGVDIRQWPIDSLYRHVGFVLQQARLIPGLSVRDNLRLARPDAAPAAVEAAARAVGLHARLAALPDGYDTVFDRALPFSGGECQRMAIARALLADRPVMVLDEPTASLDPVAASEVNAAIRTLAQGRTVLLVAHRLHEVTDAGQILVMAHGRIVARGVHAELLAADGLYARLWRQQCA